MPPAAAGAAGPHDGRDGGGRPADTRRGRAVPRGRRRRQRGGARRRVGAAVAVVDQEPARRPAAAGSRAALQRVAGLRRARLLLGRAPLCRRGPPRQGLRQPQGHRAPKDRCGGAAGAARLFREGVHADRALLAGGGCVRRRPLWRPVRRRRGGRADLVHPWLRPLAHALRGAPPPRRRRRAALGRSRGRRRPRVRVDQLRPPAVRHRSDARRRRRRARRPVLRLCQRRRRRRGRRRRGRRPRSG